MKYQGVPISFPPELKKILDKDYKEQAKTRNVTRSSLVCEILYQHYKSCGKIK